MMILLWFEKQGYGEKGISESDEGYIGDGGGNYPDNKTSGDDEEEESIEGGPKI